MIHINQERCSGDGLCVRDCPALCLKLVNDKVEVRRASHCLNCGHCVAICPHAAISLNGVNPDSLPATTAIPTEETMTALIRGHRSIRQFREQSVPDELLRRALDVVRYAPTGKNVEDVRWLIINDKKALKRIADSVIEFMKGQSGLEGVVLSHERGHDPIFRGAPCAVFAYAGQEYHLSAANCTIAISWLDLLMPTMGIGTCWAGYVIAAALHDERVRLAMGLKDGFMPFAGLMLGWPKVRYARIPTRRQPDVTWITE